MKTSADIYFKMALRHISLASLCLLAFLLLAACGSSAKKGGYSYSQNYPRERTEQKVSTGERTECLASWYGKDFHGRPTASGEIFDMYAMTCAHKEYPLGTKVRVTNLYNGKQVDCIINDRGPFITGRDLDLSYGAARQIDLIGPGTGRVSLEVLGRDQRYIKYVKYAGPATGTVTIQAGSFRDLANAENLRRGLELHYKNVYIAEASVNGQKYNRVRIGKFSSRAEADKVAGPMAQEGYSVIVMKYEGGL